MAGSVVGSPCMMRGLRVCRVLQVNYFLQYVAFWQCCPSFGPIF